MKDGSLTDITSPRVQAADSVVVPGEPARIETTVSRDRLPADGQAQAQVIATLYDAEDNLVADGTPVQWDLSGLMDLIAASQVTQNGQVTATLRADDVDNSPSVTISAGDAQAEVDLTEQPMLIDLVADQTAVEANSSQLIHITASIHDEDGNTVPDGTPIDWLTQKGTIIESSGTVVGGQASATISVANMLQGAGTSLVLARVLEFVGKTTFDVSESVNRLSVSMSNWIAGDTQADGSWTFTLPDDSTEDLQYKASAIGRITGGVPGATAHVWIPSTADPSIALLITLNDQSGPIDVPLDAEGNGEFEVRSTGLLNPQFLVAIPLNFEIDVTNPDNNLVGQNQDTWRGATVVEDAPAKTGAAGRFFWGAVAGEGEGVAATAGDIAISFVPVIGVYSDLRDIGKGLCDWGRFGWKDDRVDKVNLGFAAAGILTELFPPGDYILDILKKVAKVVGNEAPLFKILVKMFRESVVSGNWSAYFSIKPVLLKMIQSDAYIKVANDLIDKADNAADLSRRLDRLNGLFAKFGTDLFQFFADATNPAQLAKYRLSSGQMKNVYNIFIEMPSDLMRSMRSGQLSQYVALGIGKGNWSFDAVKQFLAASANPALAETVEQLKQIAHLPHTSKWFQEGLDNASNAFEIKQAAKYKDTVISVQVPIGKKGTKGASDIDVLTSDFAIQCEARNYAGITDLGVLDKEGDKLVEKLEKTIVTVSSDPNHYGPTCKTAIVFHEPPPAAIMNKLQALVDQGKLIRLEP